MAKVIDIDLGTTNSCVAVLAILVLALLVPQRVFAAGQMWGDDVLVHQASHIYGFGMDQADKDTLLLVVSDSSTTNYRDTLYIYRSTDDGASWSYVTELTSQGDNWRFGKADIIAAKGDSDFVFTFWICNHQLWCARYPYDFSSGPDSGMVSDVGENVVDFSVCQNIYADYFLFVAYQTDQDSVIFKRSTNQAYAWTEKKNLTQIIPITAQPSVAWSRGNYIVVVGKTADDKIYTMRNTTSGRADRWKDGQYLNELDSCGHPVAAASHTLPAGGAIFWVFYERCITTNPAHYVLNYNYSADTGATWSPAVTLADSLRYPSLHVLKELDASNITLAYRYEDQIQSIYRENQQTTPDVWPISSSGVNTHDSDTLPPQRAYTIRGTDNTVMAAVLYVSFPDEGLYFNASSFTGIEDEVGIGTIKGFTLGQNYPNPFNPSTTIEYSLDSDGKVEIVVYNISGQKVKTLFDGYNSRGTHRVVWDGTGEDRNPVASGVYFYKMKSKNYVQTKKLVLTK